MLATDQDIFSSLGQNSPISIARAPSTVLATLRTSRFFGLSMPSATQ